MTTSDTAQIRQKLEMAFDDSGLSAFCLDYFPELYDRFSQGMRKDDKITYLVDYSRRQPTGFETLLEYVRKEYTMSNFHGEQLKPLIDALSVYIDSSPQSASTTKDGVENGISGSRITHTEPKVRETLPMTTSKEAKEMINIGNNAQIGEVYTGGKRQVNTGGGSYFEGDIKTSGGNFSAGRQTNVGSITGSTGFIIGDYGQVTINQGSANHDELAKQFAQIYQQITQEPEAWKAPVERYR